MHRLLILLAFRLVAAHSLHAQEPTTSPAPTSRSAEIDAWLAPLIELDVFSGVVLLMRGDSTIHERAYGLAHVEHGIRVEPGHVFRIASVSKPFTRALIGRYIDEGRLTLDAPLARWLPNFPSADSITIGMLLDHRSGVPNVNSLPYDEEALAPNTLAMLVDSLARLPLDFPAGMRVTYSNGGYAVLARVVELIADRPFGEALHEQILAPLALTETRHERDGMIVPRLAGGYMPSPVELGELVRAPFQQMATKAGGGSMVSTARDLARFVSLVGRHRILRPETWRALFPGADATLAWTGRSPGYNAAVAHDRASGVTAVVLANNYAAGVVGDVADGLVRLANSMPLPTLPVARPAPAAVPILAAAPGLYTPPTGWLGLPATARIAVRRAGDHLIVQVDDTPVDVLVPQPGGGFLARSLWSLVTFPPRDDGAVEMEVRALYRDGSVRLGRITP